MIFSSRYSGSSPRTWGTPGAVWRSLRPIRFIPTYMGNARRAPGGTATVTVHPHVHGERDYTEIPESITSGSSPRTWGTQCSSATLTFILRFIPTYMGNARENSTATASISVHPHVHGERRCFPVSGFLLVGSSPRTWGTPVFVYTGYDAPRFIPTYMGNANVSPTTSDGRSVHPHVHGERSGHGVTPSSRAGSSPRTWGTHDRDRYAGGSCRFIPTYMGNALSRTSRSPGRSVHPHVHGERSEAMTAGLSFNGSSPRTWGTRYRTTTQ